MAEDQQTPPDSMKQPTLNDEPSPSSSDTYPPTKAFDGSLNFGNGNGNSQTINSFGPSETLRHSSISSDKPAPELTNSSQWDSFTGFHWGPKSIDGGTPTTTVAVSTSAINSVLSVPMLPGVPSEPMFRQHRSLSFSMGQDPSFFGYDYHYDDQTDGINGNINNSGRHGYKSSLETMAEEEDDHDDMGRDFNRWFGLDSSSSMVLEPRQRQMSFDTGSNNVSLHARSRSSGATFGLPPHSMESSVDQHQLLAAYHLQQQQQASSSLSHRPSSDQWEDAVQTSRRRRSSLASLWNQDGDLFSRGGTSSTLETQQQQIPCTPTTPYPMPSPLYHPKDNYIGTSTMAQQDLSLQRRLSQTMDYSFPENNQSYFPLADSHQRRKSCNNGQVRRSLQHGYSTSLRGLTNQLENIHLQSEPPSPLPHSSFSTPHMRPHDYQTQQYSPSSDNGYPHQQQLFYHQPTSPHHPIPRGYSMHPYQQAPEAFHYEPSSVMSQQKPMDVYQCRQQNQHFGQSEEQHKINMNYQYTSSTANQPHLVENNLEMTTPGETHLTYSMVAASNGNLDPGLKTHMSDTNKATCMDPRLYHENGKGVPLHRFPAHGPLYMVEFKTGRIDFYYISTMDTNGRVEPMVGDLVIVEADRGKDLGKVAMVNVTCKKAMEIQQQDTKSSLDPTSSLSSSSLESSISSTPPTTEEEIEDTPQKAPSDPIYVKRIYRLAAPDEINMLLIKSQDEQRALVICQQKIKQRKLQMEVVDAEYQWDRRKMTFYFSAERRIDFRELVRDLFKVYKTRIWMCAVNNKKTNTVRDST